MSLLLGSNKDLSEQLPHNQNIFLHPGLKPSPLHFAKPPSFCLSVTRCSVPVCLAAAEKCLSTAAPLPASSLEPGSGITVRKVGCRWFWGGLSFCYVSTQDSGAFLPCKEEEFAFVPRQLSVH